MNYAEVLLEDQANNEPFIIEEPEGRYYGKNEYPYQEEAYKIIGACMEVHKVLGKGFFESVYHEALCIELTKRNIPFEAYKILNVYYKDTLLKKKFTADIFAYGFIIVELKAIEGSLDSHQA